MPSAKNYVCQATQEQIAALHALLDTRGWEFSALPYGHWRATGDRVQVSAFLSGKLVVQGAATADFVQFTLEPEILHEVRYGYENVLRELEDPRMFEPHAGIDESGKGDFLGPLVVACVYTDETSAKILLDAGVADSKTISTDEKIFKLAEIIRRATNGNYSVVAIGPEAYNRLYASFGNLNRLLAWGHSKALENVLTKVPDCPRAISDQFAKSEWTVKAALQTRGRNILLEQHPRAEADVAVAAASILARCEFVQSMKRLGEDAGLGRPLPKGASDGVIRIARQLVELQGAENLHKFAKMHFKSVEKVLG